MASSTAAAGTYAGIQAPGGDGEVGGITVGEAHGGGRWCSSSRPARPLARGGHECWRRGGRGAVRLPGGRRFHFRDPGGIRARRLRTLGRLTAPDAVTLSVSDKLSSVGGKPRAPSDWSPSVTPYQSPVPDDVGCRSARQHRCVEHAAKGGCGDASTRAGQPRDGQLDRCHDRGPGGSARREEPDRRAPVRPCRPGVQARPATLCSGSSTTPSPCR